VEAPHRDLGSVILCAIWSVTLCAVFVQRAVLVSGLGCGAGFYAYTHADIDTQLQLATASGPVLRLIDAETAHLIGIAAAQLGLFPVDTRPDPPLLSSTLWGRHFPNPIGKQVNAVALAHTTWYTHTRSGHAACASSWIQVVACSLT
jgi:hypothetical protein